MAILSKWLIKKQDNRIRAYYKPGAFVYVCGDKPLASGGGLSDLAPTMLAILGVDQPAEMTGRSLINAA